MVKSIPVYRSIHKLGAYTDALSIQDGTEGRSRARPLDQEWAGIPSPMSRHEYVLCLCGMRFRLRTERQIARRYEVPSKVDHLALIGNDIVASDYLYTGCFQRGVPK